MKTKRKKGSVLIGCGALLMIAALCLSGYNLWDEARASRSVTAVTEQVSTQQNINQENQVAEPEEIPIYELNPEMEMPVETVGNWDYVGTVAFPQRGIELAVISQWSYPALRAAPCRYSGSAYMGDLILSAHNYNSHFGCLLNMSVGEQISFTDMDGNVFLYEAVEIETLGPSDVEELEAGEWDLTLFTCTIGGQSRVTVRCEEVEGMSA